MRATYSGSGKALWRDPKFMDRDRAGEWARSLPHDGGDGSRWQRLKQIGWDDGEVLKISSIFFFIPVCQVTLTGANWLQFAYKKNVG
jgi:hypothetical protein